MRLLAKEAKDRGKLVPEAHVKSGAFPKKDLVPRSFFLVRKVPNNWVHVGIVTAPDKESFDTAGGDTIAAAIRMASKRRNGRETTQEGIYLSRRRSAFLHHRDIRRVLVLHADYVIAGVDMQDITGHAAPKVRQQIERTAADILDSDGAPER
jgi:hypothetical protein